MIVIGWMLLADSCSLVLTGGVLFAAGFCTGNQGRMLRGFSLAATAVAALAVGDALGPVAGVLLLAVTAVAVWVLRRRLRSMAASTDATGEQADA